MRWWPWVSRERLEYVEAQLAISEAERHRLLGMLLGNEKPSRPHEQPVTAVAQAAEPSEVSGKIISFTTPFDSIEERARQAIKIRKMPPTFKARVR